MKITYLNPEKEKWFLVSWTLSNKCNYRCSYCPDILHNGSTGHADWENVSNFVKNFSQSGKTICYRLSGGEPTYWNHFIDLARLVKIQGHYFSFLTNGSQSVEYYKEISKYSDAIIMSYHEEYSNVQHFIDIANAVECPIVVNLMMVQSKFDEIVGIAKQMYDNTEKLAIWPKLVLDKTSVNVITNNVSNYILSTSNTLAKNINANRNVNNIASRENLGSVIIGDGLYINTRGIISATEEVVIKNTPTIVNSQLQFEPLVHFSHS